jgi:hypothetical protein
MSSSKLMIGRIAQIFGALVICAHAQGETPISGEKLLTHCEAYLAQPGGDMGQFCEAYVRGFLQGVKARAKHVNDEETWSDRAARTRLGRNALARTSSCVPQTLTFDELIEKTVAHLQANTEAAAKSAGAAIEAALLTHYPCVKQGNSN